MSRTGPAYVETEPELVADVERKQESGDISETTAEAFIDLYEFATEVGDDVEIGGAKNANFQVKVDAHQGDYSNNPSVFTANIAGKIKIWPAKMMIDNESESVPWSADDFREFERSFQSLPGVPQGALEVNFAPFSESGSIDQFKTEVEKFVAICEEKIGS